MTSANCLIEKPGSLVELNDKSILSFSNHGSKYPIFCIPDMADLFGTKMKSHGTF